MNLRLWFAVVGVQVGQHGGGDVEVFFAVGDGAAGGGDEDELVAVGFAVGFYLLVDAFEDGLGELGFGFLGVPTLRFRLFARSSGPRPNIRKSVRVGFVLARNAAMRMNLAILVSASIAASLGPSLCVWRMCVLVTA